MSVIILMRLTDKGALPSASDLWKWEMVRYPKRGIQVIKCDDEGTPFEYHSYFRVHIRDEQQNDLDLEVGGGYFKCAR